MSITEQIYRAAIEQDRQIQIALRQTTRTA